MGWLGRCGLVVLVGSLVCVLTYQPMVIAVVALLFAAAYLIEWPARKRKDARLRELSAARGGESICDFARGFDLRAIDPWIVRAVHEQIRWRLAHIHPAFPIRADDRLKEDLYLDEDDIDMDLVDEICQRTGRIITNDRANPFAGSVQTVHDLALYFQALHSLREYEPKSPYNKGSCL